MEGREAAAEAGRLPVVVVAACILIPELVVKGVDESECGESCPAKLPLLLLLVVAASVLCLLMEFSLPIGAADVANGDVIRITFEAKLLRVRPTMPRGGGE